MEDVQNRHVMIALDEIMKLHVAGQTKQSGNLQYNH